MLQQGTGKARNKGADREITVDDKVRQGRERSKFGDVRILVALKLSSIFYIKKN